MCETLLISSDGVIQKGRVAELLKLSAWGGLFGSKNRIQPVWQANNSGSALFHEEDALTR